jgi:Ca2+-binding EF-hand superfamily protein
VPRTLLAASCVALVTACGPSEPPKPKAGEAQVNWKNFEQYDKDRDGKVSRAEAAAGPAGAVQNFFDKMDTNKDGFVTKAEREDFARERQKK